MEAARVARASTSMVPAPGNMVQEVPDAKQEEMITRVQITVVVDINTPALGKKTQTWN